MDWKLFKNEKPNNNEEILVWFNGEGVESVDLLLYSEGVSGCWSCESDGETFYPDRWCRIVPPSDET